MTDAARNVPVLVLTREFSAIGGGFQMRRAIRIAFKGDRRHRDNRRFVKPLFHMGIFRLTVGQREPKAVIMNDDGDVVRIVE